MIIIKLLREKSWPNLPGPLWKSNLLNLSNHAHLDFVYLTEGLLRVF